MLKNDFVAEKTAIENTINKPLVPAPGAGGEAPEAAEAPEAIPLLTNGSRITLSNGTENYKIENFNYNDSARVIDAIGYTEGTFKNFSEVEGDLKIKFETDLESKKLSLKWIKLMTMTQKIKLIFLNR